MRRHVYMHVHRHACRSRSVCEHVRADMRTDKCMEVNFNVCVDMRVDICADMCVDMCVDMWIDMCVGM